MQFYADLTGRRSSVPAAEGPRGAADIADTAAATAPGQAKRRLDAGDRPLKTLHGHAPATTKPIAARTWQARRRQRDGYTCPRHRMGAKLISITIFQSSDHKCIATFFGRPFVKRFALCYHTVVCLSVGLSVCLFCLFCL